MNTKEYGKYKQVQIKTASPGKLILLLYQGAIRELKKAKNLLEQEDFGGKGDALIKAQDIVMELNVALDVDAAAGPRFSYTLSVNDVGEYKYRRRNGFAMADGWAAASPLVRSIVTPARAKLAAMLNGAVAAYVLNNRTAAARSSAAGRAPETNPIAALLPDVSDLPPALRGAVRARILQTFPASVTASFRSLVELAGVFVFPLALAVQLPLFVYVLAAERASGMRALVLSMGVGPVQFLAASAAANLLLGLAVASLAFTAYQRVGAWHSSATLYNAGIASHPHEVRHYVGLAGAQIAEGRSSEAREVIDAGLEQVGRDPRLLQTLGWIQTLQDQPEAAKASLEEALSANPHLRKANNNLAMLQLRAGEHAAARATASS